MRYFFQILPKLSLHQLFGKKVRTKDLNTEEANDLIGSFINDYEKFTFIEVDAELVFSARNLVSKYGLKGLRTLDSIQLASVLRVKSGLSFAVSADDLLKSLINLEEIITK